MDPLSIEGAWAYTPVIRSDARGSFLELFRGGEFLAALGYRLEVAQAHCSVSRRGVIRGIHFADVPPGQAKYISCLSGAVLDVVVDLRTGSPGYGRWEAVRLDDENRRSLFISEGLRARVHGAERDRHRRVPVLRAVRAGPGTRRAPARPGGGHRLAGWPRAGPVGKDAAAPSLAEARAAGLLPSYRDCQAHTEALRAAARPPTSYPA